MKSIQDIKDEYAEEIGKKNWSNLLHLHGGATDAVWHIICERFAEEVARYSLKLADISTKKTLREFALRTEGKLSKCLTESIINEDNIPIL